MRSRRLRRWLVLAVTYLSVFAVGGILVADWTLHPARRVLANEEAADFRHTLETLHGEMQEASITTSDHVILRGWIVRPQHDNNDAVILLHGLADNRLGMSGYAQLFLAHGFTVLMPDARAHGESGGAIAT
jgi:hypothetical protein